MASIRTPEELLNHLAARGDTTAFATLSASQARAAYVALRRKGKNHADAMAVLVPSFKKIQSSYKTKPRDVPFDDWFGTQLRRRLPDGLSVETGATAAPGELSGDDLADFERQLRLTLLRNRDRAKAGGCTSVHGKPLFFSNARSFLGAAAAAAFLFAAAAAGLYLWLSLTHVAITVTESTPDGRRRTIDLPADINLLFSHPQAARDIPSLPAVAPKNERTTTEHTWSDSTVHGTGLRGEPRTAAVPAIPGNNPAQTAVKRKPRFVATPSIASDSQDEPAAAPTAPAPPLDDHE